MSAPRPTVLITGANTGLGYAAAAALWESSVPYTLILAGRSSSKIAAAIEQLQAWPSPGGSTLESVTLDITSDASIAAAASTVSASHAHLDALVNNAGGSFDGDMWRGTSSARDAFNRTLDLNVSSAHAVTEVFAPLLIGAGEAGSSARLVFITSGLASLEEERSATTPAEARRQPVPAGWPKPPMAAGFSAYRASKAALNMVHLMWARALKQDGVRCFCVSPGFLATNLGGDPEAFKKAGALDPKVGGEFLRDVIAGKRDDDAGYAIRADSVQPW